MPKNCPYCVLDNLDSFVSPKIVRFGLYNRTSDGKCVQRFRCLACRKSFSTATFSACFRQKKRHKNDQLRRLLSSCVSQRRAAFQLNLNRTTVIRKFLFLGMWAELKLSEMNRGSRKAASIEFDDLETFEHTKCKPLSVTLAVEFKTRRILGFRVSQMAAKGLLVKKAQKYGWRPDLRSMSRASLFSEIRDLVAEDAIIKSDLNPHYKNDVERFFPKASYFQFEGKRGSITGQGELKKTRFDPLFSLNQTCAKLRADVNRLVRRTWCTTKKPDRLHMHLAIYAVFHNEVFAGTKI